MQLACTGIEIKFIVMSINITFPDGSVKSFERGITGYEIAQSISPRLAADVLAATVVFKDDTKGKGTIYDLDRPIMQDASVRFHKWEDDEAKHVFWHSSSHLLAQALEALYPGVKFGIGPAIENGFYYDVDLEGRQISESDLKAVEDKMMEFARSKERFVRKEVSKEEAMAAFREKGDEYKCELIGELQDGTISFSFNIGAPVYMFNETFDKCEGQGGNDGNFSGLAMATPTYDNDGWTGETPRAGYLCARFGTSRAAGWATTPSITLSGEHKLSFMAAPYTGGGTSLTVEVAEGNATLQQSTFTMKNGGWTNFETTINGSGPVKLTFKTNSGMFYLDEVIVNEAEGSTGIDNITVSPSTDNDRRIYSVDGRYVGTDDTKLGKGLYIRNGKKFIKR